MLAGKRSVIQYNIVYIQNVHDRHVMNMMLTFQVEIALLPFPLINIAFSHAALSHVAITHDAIIHVAITLVALCQVAKWETGGQLWQIFF